MLSEMGLFMKFAHSPGSTRARASGLESWNIPLLSRLLSIGGLPDAASSSPSCRRTRAAAGQRS